LAVGLAPGKSPAETEADQRDKVKCLELKPKRQIFSAFRIVPSAIQEYSTILYIANGSTFVLQRDALLRSFDLFGLKNILMSIKRKLVNIQTPAGQPGFLGRGHIARPVIQIDYADSDPFIMLMDDMLDKKDDTPVGGPHPHAGFETVSLLLEGEMGDDAHKMKGGDLQMMTAGSGIIHTETIEKKATMRLLQLWLNLPKKHRWTTPRVQDLPLEHVPQKSENGLEVKVYSGSFANLSSPVQNYVPVIIADIKMQPRITTVQQIPATYSTFLYVIDGSVQVGEDKKLLQHDQVGWLDRFSDTAESELILTASETGARFVLYAAHPQGDAIVSHGPFIGDTQEDIRRLYHEYNQGKMQHISTVPQTQRFTW
jgi:redox-sensitive bicupin YhaK (pirin superfamily)